MGQAPKVDAGPFQLGVGWLDIVIQGHGVGIGILITPNIVGTAISID